MRIKAHNSGFHYNWLKTQQVSVFEYTYLWEFIFNPLLVFSNVP